MCAMEHMELEQKIASIESKIDALSAQLAELVALIQQNQNNTTEKVAEPKRPKESSKEIAVQSIMAKTGWTYTETVAKVREATERIGINYTRYDKFNFHAVPVEDQLVEYRTILENLKAKSKKEKLNLKKDKYVHTVMEHTGWTYKAAKEKMDHATELCGAEYKDYVLYNFWELEDDVQKTYFTKGMANALRKKYNTNPDNIPRFMNKNEFDEEFEEFLGRPWAHVPTVTLEEFKSRFENEPKIIYKPLSDSCGHGVTLFDLNAENLEEVYNHLVTLPEGVVEGFVVQHAEMSKFSSRSVNTVRVVSIRDFDAVNILYAGFRMGGGDSVVDNFHAGGVVGMIDPETGVVVTDAIDLGGNFYDKHPVTGEVIKGFQIPYWTEIQEMLQKAGRVVEGVGYVGWDVAITENGPILIEGNTAPAPSLLQTPYAKMGIGMAHIATKYLQDLNETHDMSEGDELDEMDKLETAVEAGEAVQTEA